MDESQSRMKVYRIKVLARAKEKPRFHHSETIYTADLVVPGSGSNKHVARRVILEDIWRRGGLVSQFLSIIEKGGG